MKKPKFKYVPQQEDCDCGIACLAMVTGHPYGEVYFSFKRRGPTKFKQEVQYLRDQGLYVVGMIPDAYINRERINEIMLRPFADIHLVCFKQFVDSDINHVMVMTNKGKLYDPQPTIKDKVDLKDIYLIEDVVGIYYEK